MLNSFIWFFFWWIILICYEFMIWSSQDSWSSLEFLEWWEFSRRSCGLSTRLSENSSRLLLWLFFHSVLFFDLVLGEEKNFSLPRWVIGWVRLLMITDRVLLFDSLRVELVERVVRVFVFVFFFGGWTMVFVLDLRKCEFLVIGDYALKGIVLLVFFGFLAVVDSFDL